MARSFRKRGRMKLISDYATLTTKALASHGELITTAMDNHIENRETVLRLIEKLVMNGTLSNKDDVEYILNRKLDNYLGKKEE